MDYKSSGSRSSGGRSSGSMSSGSTSSGSRSSASDPPVERREVLLGSMKYDSNMIMMAPLLSDLVNREAGQAYIDS